MRRRILFVTQQLPWPTNSGGNIRTFHMLAGLAERFDVVLCSNRSDPKSTEAGTTVFESMGVEVHLVNDTKQSSNLGIARSVVSSLVRGAPAMMRHNNNPALRKIVNEQLKQQEFDSVHINHLDTAPYFDLPKAPPSVVDTHNLLFEFYARRSEVESNMLRRWVCAREARMFETHEPEILREASRVVVCSQTEQHSLNELAPGLEVRVVPNGVDCANFQPNPTELASSNKDMVFVGDLGYGPNKDAAERFVESILPLVIAKEPDARFLVVGKNPPQELVTQSKSRKDLVVTGMVDDVREWVHKARVCVVPIRYGSGTRLKVLEAFALGMPTVSTRVGAEGIKAKDGENIFLRDEPKEMADAIVRLMREPELAASLGAHARTTVESDYDWPALGVKIASVHAELHRAPAKN